MSISGLLNQKVTVYNKTGYNRYGRETVGNAGYVYARMQVGKKSKLLPNGQVQTVEAIAFVLPDTTIAVNDKVTYDSIDYKVADVSKMVDDTGTVHHLELSLIKWQTT